MVEFRCPSCATPLSEGLAKCPSCGLPLKPQASVSRGRSLFAGFLLMALFAVGALQAGLIIASPEAAIQPGSTFQVGSFTLEGSVRDSNGTAISGVNVTLGGGAGDANPRNASTGPDGTFRFQGVPIGVYELNGTFENRSAVQQVMVRQDLNVDLLLPTSAGVARTQHESLGFIRIWLQVCGGVLLGLSLLTLLGSVAAYRRRFWPLAVTGAVAGAVLWLPLSLLLGLIALVLLLKGRGEFS